MLHNPAAMHVWQVELKNRNRFTEILGGWEINEKETKVTDDDGGCGGTQRLAMNTQPKEDRGQISRQGGGRQRHWERENTCNMIVVACMCTARGCLLNHRCEVRWIGSINESVSHCVVTDPGHTHTDTHDAHSSGSYHYPSLHPPFGISRPDRSWPITLSHSKPAYLSLYHPLSYLALSVSLFHTISPLFLSQPPHTTLLPTNCISFKIA